MSFPKEFQVPVSGISKGGSKVDFSVNKGSDSRAPKIEDKFAPIKREESFVKSVSAKETNSGGKKSVSYGS